MFDEVYKMWRVQDKEYAIGQFTKAEAEELVRRYPEKYEAHRFTLRPDPMNWNKGRGMLGGRDFYKPFDYPYAYEYWEVHEKMHWLPDEVNFENDVTDWTDRLNDDERNFLTQLFRFFTQADIQVNAGYSSIFLPKLKNVPELNLLCSSIAAREGVHVVAYSQLIDTIGMEESEYKAFQEYEEMAQKHQFLEEFCADTPYDLAKTFAVYNGFAEGMQLFSSFAMLLNFARFGKMNGMIEIVSWSIRDESLHVESMCKVYHDFIKQYRRYIDKRRLNAEVRECAQKMVDLEDKFIDLAYNTGGIQGLDKEEVKQYIRYTADFRLDQYGMRPIFGIKENPLPWIDEIVSGKEHANFFERRATEYGKANVQGTVADVKWELL